MVDQLVIANQGNVFVLRTGMDMDLIGSLRRLHENVKFLWSRRPSLGTFRLARRRLSSGSATWTGRGKHPRWWIAAMKSGRKIEEFRISVGNAARSRKRA